ncbi:MAG: class C sortase [Clostridiales bacterium]|nr:class C sortase [Clostridiales bacterium]
MKKHFSTILLIVIFLIGLSLLLYPSVSNYWNSIHQTRAISNYLDTLNGTDDSAYEELLKAASDYNTDLGKKNQVYEMTEEETERYLSQLDITGSGMMGYVVIPSIGVELPIYHGTAENVLQSSVGHLEWSSLPVGGAGTHSVLSGHRGLPSAKLLTDLDKLAVGDLFMLQILNETLTYEIDQILIVEPENTSALMIVPGQDLCTLFTCTPYGINTHRLLVRGHRMENLSDNDQLRLISDAIRIDPMVVTPLIAVPILLVLLVFLMIKTRKRKRNNATEKLKACDIEE